MRILILNQDWFAAEWRSLGHEVTTVGFSDHLDITLDRPLMHIHRIFDLLKQLGRGVPEVIVALDNSAPISIQGVDECEIPSLFYSVDTHHHLTLHKYLGFLFDEVLVAQKDYLPSFFDMGLSPSWFPLWASRPVEPSEVKTCDAVFVGTLNKKLNPERVEFFKSLQEQIPVTVQSGNFWEIFPQAEIVINQTVKKDLNFRVFEAMMSGSALLTERIGNGLFDLFTENTHLVCYEKNDVAGAAEAIKRLLKDRDLCRKIGRAGREEILAKHTTMHRATELLARLTSIKKRTSPIKHYAAMINFSALGSRLEKIDTVLAAQAYIASLKSAEMGLFEKEPLSEELACHVIIACYEYERRIRTGAAYTFLQELGVKNPGLVVMVYARIHLLLNQGKQDEAVALAQQLPEPDSYTTFCKSQKFITDLLAGGSA